MPVSEASGPAVLAIDIGGTKMAAGVIDVAGAVLASDRIATPTGPGADDLFGALEALCRRVLSQSGSEVSALGVGCGGPMQYPAGVVTPLNIPAWRDFPLRDRLIGTFGKPTVV